MKLILPIDIVEKAIASARYGDPAYEPGRAKSSVAHFELNIDVPLRCSACDRAVAMVLVDVESGAAYCAACAARAQVKQAKPPATPDYLDLDRTGFFDLPS